MSLFARFPPRLQDAIVARLGWTALRPVQELAGTALLDGANAVILAPTAGGKTEAALFPVLAGLIDEPAQGVAALYVAPIKALLNNQSRRLDLYTEMVGLRRFVWHGDTPSHARRGFLAEPCELLMTTPESLEVMLMSPRVDAAALFADLRVLVVDEIHALAGTDRGAHLMSVVERLARLSRHDLQRIGLSATVGNPECILQWITGTSCRSGQVIAPPADPAPRRLHIVYRPDLPALSAGAARLAQGAKSLFFCETRALAESVAEQMRRLGTAVLVHHSAISKEERDLAEARFQSGSDACIVCTSTLELGIDVGDLDLVLQADAPATVGSFLQRMGRTGRRAGQTANTTFLCGSTDAVVQAIALVELAKAGWVESIRVNDRCWPVLIHQLIAMSLAHDGIGIDDAWSHLSGIPDFRGIAKEEFYRLVDWMRGEQSMLLLGGRLVIGPKIERSFGRRNFMDLYSVFSSPQSYAVQTTHGQPLGSLNQDFVDRLVDEVSCFLLSGRAWAVVRVQHADRQVIVEAAPRGRQPTWGGFLPQFLSNSLCQRILAVLTSTEEYPYLSQPARDALALKRDEVGDILEPVIGGVELDDGEIRWWTYAGGTINSTVRHAISAIEPDWKITADNLLVRLRGEGVDGRHFSDALGRLGSLGFWDDTELWQDISRNLPGYRLSKFQPLMPSWVERETLERYLLDLEGTRNWLARTAPS
ncbi:DEAD/DEAH box helicase domain protein [Thiocapsa sp. KS1]|nr:DEAD/DEAH box helicase domain protein [Thiocapsa sp. KS1]